MRTVAVVLALLVALNVEAWASDDSSAAVLDSEIVRILTALEFGKDAKEIFANAISRGELDAETARAIANISERRFVELAAPSFRSLLRLEEAKELADFYSTDEMRAMLAEHKRSSGAAPFATNRQQAVLVESFMRSKAAEAAVRVQKALLEPEFLNELNNALEEELLRKMAPEAHPDGRAR